MSEHTYGELVETWIRLQYFELSSNEYKCDSWSNDEAWDLAGHDPEKAFKFILDVLARDQSDRIMGNLSAGPLEDLLAKNGKVIIEKIEAQAKADPKFAYLLGGVWKNAMTDEIWIRVQKVWDRRGWDGILR